MQSPVFAVGDVHGYRDTLARLLRDAGLVDRAERWLGRDAILWLLGDLVDRGPDGIGAIDLVRRLEHESQGNVRCLLGNHEAFLVAALRAGNERLGHGDMTFGDVWRFNGGVERDLHALTPEHVEWILARPAIAREADWLLLHADTDAYLELGSTVAAINASAAATLREGSSAALDGLLEILCDRLRLGDPSGVDALLATLGGSRIVHGHTPIASVRGVDPREVRSALLSPDDRVVNVDHCLFGGGPGFVTRLEPDHAVAVPLEPV